MIWRLEQLSPLRIEHLKQQLLALDVVHELLHFVHTDIVITLYLGHAVEEIDLQLRRLSFGVLLGLRLLGEVHRGHEWNIDLFSYLTIDHFNRSLIDRGLRKAAVRRRELGTTHELTQILLVTLILPSRRIALAIALLILIHVRVLPAELDANVSLLRITHFITR